MKILQNEPLAPYTSLRVGGLAEKLVIAENYDEAVSILHEANEPLWILGYGCNCLVSDAGLPGTTLMLRGGSITVNETEIIADAGVWWDEVVETAIAHSLWGLELLSGVPSSTGGAIFGNIAAYGCQVSDTLAWVELYDISTRTIEQYGVSDINFTYRHSSLQNMSSKILVRAGFRLTTSAQHELRYESARIVARELDCDTATIAGRRQAIMETRRRAGSLYDPNNPTPERTAGSFFKNPHVEYSQAKKLAEFDESGKTLERLLEQNAIHGGSPLRASAAHVLLASGFRRGQQWGLVQLHPSHVLKVATLPGASATEVYTVVQDILKTVKEKTGIVLEPEVRFLGSFDGNP